MHLTQQMESQSEDLYSPLWVERYALTLQNKDLLPNLQQRLSTLHSTRDFDIDEGLFYDKSEVNPWEFAYREWENSDNSFFADPLEFDEEQPENNAISTLISRRKDVDSPKSGKSGDYIGSIANNNNDSNIESAFTSVQDCIESPPRRTKRNRNERVYTLAR